MRWSKGGPPDKRPDLGFPLRAGCRLPKKLGNRTVVNGLVDAKGVVVSPTDVDEVLGSARCLEEAAAVRVRNDRIIRRVQKKLRHVDQSDSIEVMETAAWR